MKKFKTLFSKDYRHYLCMLIIVGFLGCGFLFPNALPRVAESFRDLGTSIVFYIYGIYSDNPNSCPLRPTVNAMQSWEFTESPWEPLSIFPWTWTEFKSLWKRYWSSFIDIDNFLNYCYSFSSFFQVLGQILTALLPLVLLLWLYGKKYTDPDKLPELDKNGIPLNINKDSRPLKIFKGFLFKVVYPALRWIKSFVGFVRENEKYWQTWLCLWLLYFNIISMGVALFAFFMYLVIAWDFETIYVQINKLLVDLAPMVRFLPGIVWFVVAYLILNHITREMGFAQLEHNERKNRGFLNERGVVTVIYGNMGTGKTRMLTSLALSAEKQLRDQALEILLEVDMKFPNFPWQNLRAEVKRRMQSHQIVDVFSIRRWIREWKAQYVYHEENSSLKWLRRKVRSGKVKEDYTFDFDFEHYRSTYNDNLTITHLFDAISDYAQAFFVYSIQTSLILSNYSIRVDLDRVNEDQATFPAYNDDFFRRNPKYMGLYSRYCHIIDFDMLRLGKRMLEDNPNRNALGFGVYVVSEIDKERKNELQMRKTRKKKESDTEEECTQDNDLFNACLKMIRHATVIANRVFVKFLCDLQRPEDWGAGGREVGEVVFIESKDEKVPVLPIMSPYWLINGIYNICSGLNSLYLKYIRCREDNTLFMYLVHNFITALGRYVDRNEKLFGCQEHHLQVESGRMDGNVLERVFYGMDKKDFSGRYCTDAMASIFDLPNAVSIAEVCEYATVLASKAERDKQHSHFQADIDKAVS